MPRQLANRTQAHPLPINLLSRPYAGPHDIRYYPRVGTAIPEQGADCLRVTHPFAAIHCWTARLACIRHATSVRSEPGSNSSLIFKVLVPLITFVSLTIPRNLLDPSLSTSPIPSIFPAASRASVLVRLSSSALSFEGEANYRTFCDDCQVVLRIFFIFFHFFPFFCSIST